MVRMDSAYSLKSLYGNFLILKMKTIVIYEFRIRITEENFRTYGKLFNQKKFGI